MSFVTIGATQVDAKSPIDDTLMGEIKQDLDDLDSRVVVAGASPYVLELVGKLSYVNLQKRSFCGGIVGESFAPTKCRFMLKKSGLVGNLAFDIRQHTSPKTPITAVSHQYSGGTTSIVQSGSAVNTQSIARAGSQISTQSITFAKSANNVTSILPLGTQDVGETSTANLVQYNLTSAVDSDTLVGDSVVFASCTAGGNNGTFTIVEIGRGGGNNVVIVNASGVAQTGAVGNLQVAIISYNFTNPVDTTIFQAGYSALFASHTTGANNGTLLIYAVNRSGNNIWIKSATGVTQGGVAGTVDTFFWKFNLSSPASATDFIVGEGAKTASHTTSGNNAGALPIIALNSGGNNLWLYNTSGAVQAGVLGNINTNRWSYTMPTDPTSQVSVNDYVYASAHTTAANNAEFQVKAVTASTITVYNTGGVAQGGTVGTVVTTRKLIQFASDQSAVYTTASYVECRGLVDALMDLEWNYPPLQVVQVNRGGGANYNIVVQTQGLAANAAASQASPGGYVVTEMKSIFSAAPSIAPDLTGLSPNRNLSGVSTSMVGSTIAASTPLYLYLTSVPTGDPQDLTVIFR